MALFGGNDKKETKEDKQARKEQALLAKYGLDSLTDPIDISSVQKIVSELIGTGLMETGMKLSFSAKTEEQLQVQYQRILLEQNWIIIRQLDRLNQILSQK
jgi:hypothetical protein